MSEQEASNFNGLRSFEDLIIWQEARALRKDIFELTKGLPSDERYRLSDQLIRASRSIGNNIAEGYGRYHYQEFIQFCRHSRGSLEEVKDHLLIALDCQYMSQQVYDQYKTRIDVLTRKLNAFISYLKSRKQQ